HTRIKGTVLLERARIRGRLTANGILVEGGIIDDARMSLSISYSRIDGLLSMTGLVAKGEVRIRGARIGGALAATELKIEQDTKNLHQRAALNAEQARILQDWFMGRADIKGQLILRAAELRGQLRISGAISNENDEVQHDAIIAERLQTRGDFT